MRVRPHSSPEPFWQGAGAGERGLRGAVPQEPSRRALSVFSPKCFWAAQSSKLALIFLKARSRPGPILLLRETGRPSSRAPGFAAVAGMREDPRGPPPIRRPRPKRELALEMEPTGR
jgi:hypothetical protein